MESELTQMYDDFVKNEGEKYEALTNDYTKDLFDMFNEVQQVITENVEIEIQTDAESADDGTVSLMQSKKLSSNNDNSVYKGIAAKAIIGVAVSAIAVTCLISSSSKKVEVEPNQEPLL